MNPPSELAQKIARQLEGTSMDSVESICEYNDWDISREQELEVYTLVDRCSVCDCWFRRSELVDDDSCGYWCRECKPKPEDK